MTSAAAMQGTGPAGLEHMLSAGSWRAVESDTPAARTADGGGVEFPCPFHRAHADRFYWDHRASLRLSPGMALDLDLTVPRPEAFRALHVYLESGPGWYVATLRPQRPAGPESRAYGSLHGAARTSIPPWCSMDYPWPIRSLPWSGEPGPARLPNVG